MRGRDRRGNGAHGREQTALCAKMTAFQLRLKAPWLLPLCAADDTDYRSSTGVSLIWSLLICDVLNTFFLVRREAFLELNTSLSAFDSLSLGRKKKTQKSDIFRKKKSRRPQSLLNVSWNFFFFFRSHGCKVLKILEEGRGYFHGNWVWQLHLLTWILGNYGKQNNRFFLNSQDITL